jgi:hypothetical protein
MVLTDSKGLGAIRAKIGPTSDVDKTPNNLTKGKSKLIII